MRFLRSPQLRTRLTLWYLTVLAGALFLYGGGMSVVFWYQLRAQLDYHAIEQLETLEGYFHFLPNGKVHLKTDYHDHPYPESEQERFIEVLALDGTPLYRSELLKDRPLDGPPTPDEGFDQYSPRSLNVARGTRVRVISRRHPVDGKPVLIRLGLSEIHLWETLANTMAGLLGGIPLVLALAGLSGYQLTKRALRPLSAMSRRAREINAEQLNARLPVGHSRDEPAQLAAAFNDTLARLEQSFDQLRRFTSDAAHELRTPLTAIRSVGEVGLQRAATQAEYRDVIESMLEESARLSRLVEDLLLVARGDSGRVRLEKKPLVVVQQVREVYALLEVLAEEKRQTVTIAGDTGLRVEADRVIFRQILINLLDNAIKFTPPGGKIRVDVHSEASGMVAIDVRDSGPGIPPEHRERIFERFYRVDQARARETGGTGLGLAIARWGAQSHSGSLTLVSADGPGCTFRVLLPEDTGTPQDTKPA